MNRKLITINELKAHASPNVKALNTALFATMDALQKPKLKHHTRCTAKKTLAAQTTSQDGMASCRPIVSLTSYRRKLLDDDNLRGGLKTLRDQIADYLDLDDAERFIQWRYYQVKVAKRSEEGTSIRVQFE